jgi:hypothetical protein
MVCGRFRSEQRSRDGGDQLPAKTLIPCVTEYMRVVDDEAEKEILEKQAIASRSVDPTPV